MSAFVPDSLQGEVEDKQRVQPLSATERLAASRERMRQWMLCADGRADARRRNEAALAAGEKPAWIDRLRTAPVIGVVIDAANAWWANHPLQPAANLAHGVVRDAVAPLARRHPIAIVAAAFLVGIAAVRLRPWRWLIKPALFAGLTSQIIMRVVSSVPLETVLEAVGSFGRRQPAEEPAAGEAPVMPAPAAVSDAVREAETATP
jgi:hypothetical protein